MYSTTITKSVEQSLAYIAAAERSCSIGAWPESLGNGGRQVKDVLETASQGGYGLLNARLGWKTASGNAGVDLWVRNISDTFYTKDKIDLLSGFGFIYNRVGDPRT